MRDVPDQVLTPPEKDEFIPLCWNCGDRMHGGTAFRVEDYHWFCKDCFMTYVHDFFDAESLAEALGFDMKDSEYLTEYDMGE